MCLCVSQITHKHMCTHTCSVHMDGSGVGCFILQDGSQTSLRLPTCAIMPRFMWVLGIQTHVLTLAKQALCTLSHLCNLQPHLTGSQSHQWALCTVIHFILFPCQHLSHILILVNWVGDRQEYGYLIRIFISKLFFIYFLDINISSSLKFLIMFLVTLCVLLQWLHGFP